MPRIQSTAVVISFVAPTNCFIFHKGSLSKLKKVLLGMLTQVFLYCCTQNHLYRHPYLIQCQIDYLNMSHSHIRYINTKIVYKIITFIDFIPNRFQNGVLSTWTNALYTKSYIMHSLNLSEILIAALASWFLYRKDVSHR